MNITRGEEIIYRKVLHAYQLEDAQYWVDYLLDEELTDEQKETIRKEADYDWLVYLYNDKMDCDVAENDTWWWIVTDYLDCLYDELGMDITA